MIKWRLAPISEIKLNALNFELVQSEIRGWYDLMGKVKNNNQFKIWGFDMFEITQYKEINKSALIATFTLKINKWGDFCIREMAYFKSNDKRWVTFPSRQYEKDGQKKYFQFCTFETNELNETFKAKVLEALDKHIATLQPKAIQNDLFQNQKVNDVPF